MKALIFGATGMVGSGVVKECLADPLTDAVTVVGRTATHIHDTKLTEILKPDLFRFQEVVGDLKDFDACYFCLGVSSFGMKEADYTHMTYDLTMGLAKILAANNPQMTFMYVSGASTDSSEKGSIMWARIKGRTENALLALPFKAAYMFRPGVIIPVEGARSKTRLYQTIYTLFAGPLNILQKMFPKGFITTKQLGQVMNKVAQQGAPMKVLETGDMKALANA